MTAPSSLLLSMYRFRPVISQEGAGSSPPTDAFTTLRAGISITAQLENNKGNPDEKRHEKRDALSQDIRNSA